MLHPTPDAPNVAITSTTTPPLVIEYPDDLPVSQQRQHIQDLLRQHQVVIVCGETGSGKTTQLPKMCLELGYGDPTRGKKIGHTQPRRLAATTTAQRIAVELNSPLGELVGYQVRFHDRASPTTRIKLMTDGILLAESQRDRLLKHYDALIIDEAHERSLNIDFLLGYLQQMRHQRPDLKIIITSATIDAEQFSRHFGGAPVVHVSGRLYPVEMRYQPLDELHTATTVNDADQDTAKSRDKDDDLVHQAIARAIQECWSSASPLPVSERDGDILVFMPGEREIRDAQQFLQGQFRHHANPSWRNTVILSLFARLSIAEQARIYQPTGERRIILSTNVAETSLTVPNIRYVIDTGTARVKRYSYRNKVEQLHIEAISQAAANQRAGRCGRIGAGMCIRLYAESDYLSRPLFTDAEIYRASLASVILRMHALRLSPIEDFAFLDRPAPKAIADGYQLLQELGALDELNHLTPIGKQLARLPLDPKIGRMLLASQTYQCQDAMTIIASRLATQDPRDTPQEARQAAEQAHAQFKDPRSEFLSDLKLWQWAKHHQATLSRRQFEQLCRKTFISPIRLREWMETQAQLTTTLRDVNRDVNRSVKTVENLPAAPLAVVARDAADGENVSDAISTAQYEAIHLALLSGLIGNIGRQRDEASSDKSSASKSGGQTNSGDYLGCREIKFFIHPGSTLHKKAGKWILAGELVETQRLYARCIAKIEPQWIERIAKHAIKTTHSHPHFEQKSGQVVALERGTLHGLTVYVNRKVQFAPINLALAREIFIREALVNQQLDERQQQSRLFAFYRHNLALMDEISDIEHQTRRPDVLVDDDTVFSLYDEQIPAEVCSLITLEKWLKAQQTRDAVKESRVLYFDRDALMRKEGSAALSAWYPKQLNWRGVSFTLDYHFEPHSPRDGVTLTIPITLINQVDAVRCEWLVAGMLKEKVTALLKTLPQKAKHRLMPLPNSAQAYIDTLTDADFAMPLLTHLAKYLSETIQLPIQVHDFKSEQLSAHCLMNFKLVDAHERQLDLSRDLAALRANWAHEAQQEIRTILAPSAEVNARALGGMESVALNTYQPMTTWAFDTLPELLTAEHQGQTVVGFPALVDTSTDRQTPTTWQVEIHLFDDERQRDHAHRAGCLRLFAISMKEQIKFYDKNIPNLHTLSMKYLTLMQQLNFKQQDVQHLKQQIVQVGLERAFLVESLPMKLPMTQATFQQQAQDGKQRFGLLVQEVAKLVDVILTVYQQVHAQWLQCKGWPAVQQDIQQQLAQLLSPSFIQNTPWQQLQHVPRYLKGIVSRIDKLKTDPQRDQRWLADWQSVQHPWQREYQQQLKQRHGAVDEKTSQFRWLLEELRVSLFAQELKTPMPISVKRLQKIWQG
jgi:ATP-dependent helicase HrpA